MYRRIGTIGRFQPINNRGAIMLFLMSQMAEEIVIGLGSANKDDVRNPFSTRQVQDMIEFVTNDIFDTPCSFVSLDDFGNGKIWMENTTKLMGNLDALVTGNPYVAALLGHHYPIINTSYFATNFDEISPHSSEIRTMMINGTDWENHVPIKVSQYLKSTRDNNKSLVDYFIETFAVETLQLEEEKRNSKLTELEWEKKFNGERRA